MYIVKLVGSCKYVLLHKIFHSFVHFFTGIQENFDDRAYHLWLCICVMKIAIILSPLSGGVKADPIPQWDIKLFYVHLFLRCGIPKLRRSQENKFK